MKEELYEWMKNLAVFYILLTAVLHLVPDNKYEKYVRFFMGLLLILMMSTPVFALFGKKEALLSSFQANFGTENTQREQSEFENLQRACLEKGYAMELRLQIENFLREEGIEFQAVQAEFREDEGVFVTLYLQAVPSEEQEVKIRDGLGKICRIGEEGYEIRIS